jgi:putative acetyltransferase
MEECASRADVVRPAHSPRDMAQVHALFVEYAQWLQVDLCFQGFEEELATLPGVYAPPRGRLLLVGAPDAAFGCIALRPLDAKLTGTEDPVGEVKRLYVRAPYRGQGWGLRLAHALLDEARMIGYRELRLDTFDWMTSARALYASLGFRDRAPYYDNPLAGAVYMSRAL